MGVTILATPIYFLRPVSFYFTDASEPSLVIFREVRINCISLPFSHSSQNSAPA